jgi:hypothetical protein
MGLEDGLDGEGLDVDELGAFVGLVSHARR